MYSTAKGKGRWEGHTQNRQKQTIENLQPKRHAIIYSTTVRSHLQIKSFISFSQSAKKCFNPNNLILSYRQVT